MDEKPKFLLGQLLLEKKIITPEQLETALRKQKETNELLGIILLKMGFIDEEMVFLPVLAGHLGFDYINLKETNIPREVIQKIPPKFATYYKIIPFEYENGVLSIATMKPSDVNFLDEISLAVNAKLKPALAFEKDIMDAIRQYYGVGADTIAQMMNTVEPADQKEHVAEIEEIESEASISKFLNQIFYQAHKDRATDIHIEPYEDELKIRYRIDGILYDAKVPATIKHFKDAIISRIKILSNLNIAEKRLPQDGRFKLRVSDVELDMRISFMPTPWGESVVLRLLNTVELLSLHDLGFKKEERDIIEDLIKRPHGIIFLTGPTGSGKTTTLYSCLSQINTEDRKIITIEDPIEYQLKGITQIQINPAIGLTFAKGLRSMLRHDPDVMMIGEVRDIETAEIAIQISLTGHLVFSTLHTNDAASGVTRLLDMGIQPYLITSTIECFIAQRLVRVICPRCKEKTEYKSSDFKHFNFDEEEVVIYKGMGCETCNFTGYLGRSSIYEILLINEGIRKLIMNKATASQIKEKAVECGMKTLYDSGWEKIKHGITTPEEVIRVTQE